MASPIHIATIAATLHRRDKRTRCPRCGHKKPARSHICTYCGKHPLPNQQNQGQSSGLGAWLKQLFG